MWQHRAFSRRWGTSRLLTAALAKALKRPERRAELRAKVDRIASFDHASDLIAES